MMITSMRVNNGKLANIDFLTEFAHNDDCEITGILRSLSGKIIFKYYRVSQKKVPTLKIHNAKTTTRIGIIQILVKGRKIKVFL